MPDSSVRRIFTLLAIIILNAKAEKAFSETSADTWWARSSAPCPSGTGDEIAHDLVDLRFTDVLNALPTIFQRHGLFRRFIGEPMRMHL